MPLFYKSPFNMNQTLVIDNQKNYDLFEQNTNYLSCFLLPNIVTFVILLALQFLLVTSGISLCHHEFNINIIHRKEQ